MRTLKTIALAWLAAAAVATAQTLTYMPAKQVTVDTNQFYRIRPLSTNTAQKAFEKIDELLAPVDTPLASLAGITSNSTVAEAFAALDAFATDLTNSIAELSDWIDVISNNLVNLSNDVVVISNLLANLDLAASNITTDVSGFDSIGAGATNVQLALDALDDLVTAQTRVAFSAAITNTNTTVTSTYDTQVLVTNWHSLGTYTNTPSSGFNPTTGVFTCSYPGWYMFSGGGRSSGESIMAPESWSSGLGSTNWNVAPPTVGTTSENYPYTTQASAGSNAGSFSSMLKHMALGESMCLWVNSRDAGLGSVEIYHLSFSGALLFGD